MIWYESSSCPIFNDFAQFSFVVETARAIGSGRVGGGTAMRQNIPQQQQQPQFVVSHQPPAVMEATLNAQPLNYPTIDQFIPPQQHQRQHQHQPQYQAPPTIPVLVAAAPAPVPVQAVPVQKPMSNIVNGVPFKLPSVQDRLIKNRVFFDGNLKNEAQPSNGKTVAGNE